MSDTTEVTEPTTPPLEVPPQLEMLRSAIKDSPVYYSGLLPVPDVGLPLFYKGNGTTDCFDVTKATEEDLDKLVSACQAATFGVGQKDVLDETYRKAGKLDTQNFAMNLDISQLGLIDRIRTELLEGKNGRKGIKAELYKLNVYGKGSFFKSHKDTPRAQNMFGSLVLVFPTPHDGGSLVLRHGDKEWTFDSANLLGEEKRPSIAFASFFGDVDHEVSPVKSGHRVTLTYNLYFTEKESPVQRPSPSSVTNNATEFKKVLELVLKDPSFLPEGGTLGFKLRHQYPTSVGAASDSSDSDSSDTDATADIPISYLKGTDAAITRALRSFGIRPHVKLLYHFDYDAAGIPEYAMLDGVPKWFNGMHCESSWEAVTQYSRPKGQPAQTLNPQPPYYNIDEEEFRIKDAIGIWWVDEPAKPGRECHVATPFVALGNEPGMEYTYGDYVLLATVDKYEERVPAV
ncbi:hypothetical protein HGRIS_003897 [Hohenbuehelia grisea]|uniref:Fe2OG dioxygenase domain-containing protein n=1 Tax=Hohenbuehelia grisea TaxID=104357 RepID=A0ABR3JHH2_9AGAR